MSYNMLKALFLIAYPILAVLLLGSLGDMYSQVWGETKASYISNLYIVVDAFLFIGLILWFSTLIRLFHRTKRV